MMMPGDDAPEPVIVSMTRSSTFGFAGTGRIVALLAEALLDLRLRFGTNQPSLGPDVGVFLSLPDPAERGFELARDVEDADDPEMPQARIDALGQRLLPPVAAAAGFDLLALPTQFVGGGHSAFAAALDAAGRALASRQFRAALVAAADSLAGHDTIELFASQRRVKGSGTPTGFIPGEAAVVAWLELPPHALPPRPGAHVQIGRAMFGREPSLQDKPTGGRILTECILRAMATLPHGASAPALISDHDGEVHRAHELGCAKLQLASRNERLAEMPIWLPAASFGNTGVASSALAAAVAMRALQRGYAPRPWFVAASSSDCGARAAFSISALEPENPTATQLHEGNRS